MNLGYLWKALCNERVISAVDSWWRDNVSDRLSAVLSWISRRKNVKKVQAVEDQERSNTEQRRDNSNNDSAKYLDNHIRY